MMELIDMKHKISPVLNSLRLYLLFAINHYILTTSASDAYSFFTNAIG